MHTTLTRDDRPLVMRVMPVQRRRVDRVRLAIILLTAAIACAERRPDSARDSSAAAPADPQALFLAQRGRTWELARLGAQDLPPTRSRAAARPPGTHPGPGARPTIRFTRERLPTAPPDDSRLLSAGGWSFCNGYGAGYAVGPGDGLRFRQFHSTLVGCDGPDSLETRFFRALGATRRFVLDADTLALVAEDGSRLTFVASPDSAGPPSD